MEVVSSFLNENNIPYNEKCVLDIMGTFDKGFVIPGSVIFVRTHSIFNSPKRMDNFVELVHELNANAPYDTMYYIYVENCNSDKEMEQYRELFPEFDTNSDEKIKLEIINSLDQISFADYCYVVNTPGAIWSLINSGKIETVSHGKKIHLSQDIYDRMRVILNDEELALVTKYGATTDPTDSIYIVDITKGGLFNDPFTDFLKIEPYVRFKHGVRRPKKVIDGITTRCQTCDSIIYPKYIRDKGCIVCKKKEQELLEKQ
jgi:hypothetical protein